jgi:hypothetical protein
VRVGIASGGEGRSSNGVARMRLRLRHAMQRPAAAERRMQAKSRPWRARTGDPHPPDLAEGALVPRLVLGGGHRAGGRRLELRVDTVP